MMIEQTITVGNIIEICSIIGGGITVFVTLRNTVANIKTDVVGMQAEIKKLADILIGMARFDEKLSSMERRLSAHDLKLDELSRGDGYIISRGK